MIILPASYDTVVEIVQDDLKNGSLTLEVLRNKLSAKFKRLHKDSEQDEEMGLFLVHKKGTRKCKHCGKQGHKSEDCWSLEKNKEKFEKFKEKCWKVKCYVCGESHLAKNCPNRFGRETANQAEEEGEDELSL